MKRLLVFISILLFLPSAALFAAEKRGERPRRNRLHKLGFQLMPGPAIDPDACDHLLSGYPVVPFLEPDERKSEPGPDDVQSDY